MYGTIELLALAIGIASLLRARLDLEVVSVTNKQIVWCSPSIPLLGPGVPNLHQPWPTLRTERILLPPRQVQSQQHTTAAP